jgi:hypothetical protein
MEELTLIAHMKGDESVGIFPQQWEISDLGEIEDNEHRESVRKAFSEAFEALLGANVDVYYSDEPLCS